MSHSAPTFSGKPCPKCGGTTRYVTTSKCVPCHRKTVNAWVAKDRTAFNEKRRNSFGPKERAARASRQKKYYAENPARVLWYSARTRAKKLGMPCTLKMDEIKVPEFCPLLGIALSQGDGKMHANSPTLDRINPKLGYVPGNVWVISQRANLIKNDATLLELELLVEKLRLFLQSRR